MVRAYGQNIRYIAEYAGMNGNQWLIDEMQETVYNTGARLIIADTNKRVINGTSQCSDWNQVYDTDKIASAYAGSETSGKYIYNEKIKFIYVAIPIKVEQQVVGVVFLSNGVDDIYTAVEETTKNLAVISVLLMVLFGVFIYMIADKITRPLRRVTRAIESMDKGTLKQQVPVSGRDEIARLGDSFNRMNAKVTTMDQQMRTFVADASHELKSPLAGIKVLVQALIDGGMDDKKVTSEFLKDIDKEVDRLTGIVGNLLELTRLEGSYGIKTEEFDLGELCNAIADKLRFVAHNKKQTLQIETLPITIEANREQIYRTIYNILENAMKYSPDESFIHLWMKQGPMAVVCVSDQGPGISQEDIPKIFERFYRVEKARGRKTGGSGLGLSIAMEIARKHGGDIKVKSELNQGSTFAVLLPYSQANRELKQ